MSGRHFAWMGNKDLGDGLFGKAACTRLPNTSHGLNDYKHLHDAVLLSALNPPPAHFFFLSSIGIDSNAVRTALYRQQLYQAACRISLRNPSDTHAKLVVVPDRSTAEWLADKFPGCAVAPLAGMPELRKGKPGRPRLHESDAARKANVAKQRGDVGVGQPEVGGEAGVGVAQHVRRDVRRQPGDAVHDPGPHPPEPRHRHAPPGAGNSWEAGSSTRRSRGQRRSG